MIDIVRQDELALDTRAIEAELAEVWRQAAERTASGLVRASSLTLLVVQTDPAQSTRVEEVLSQVATAHPCRALVLSLTDGGPRARLAAHCRLPAPGQPPACWEAIRLEGGPATVARLVSAARALVVPNLPVQVWWPGEVDPSSPLFQRSLEIGDRIIVDSSRFGDPFRTLAQYADHAHTEHGTIGFVDLNWRALEPWRLLVAQPFDDPADRAFLNGLQSAVIDYERPPDAPGGVAQALLLAGWLASRLGWAAAAERVGAREAPERLWFEDGARVVGVEIRQRPASSPTAGGLAAVELRASIDGREARYAVERRVEDATTLAEVDGARREARVHLPASSDADLLQRELASFGRDRIYEEALWMVRSLERRARAPGERT